MYGEGDRKLSVEKIYCDKIQKQEQEITELTEQLVNLNRYLDDLKLRGWLEGEKFTTMQQERKIVRELLLHYKNSHLSDYDLRSFVEEIIKTATGKEPHAIHSMENVKN